MDGFAGFQTNTPENELKKAELPDFGQNLSCFSDSLLSK
jgi:hypothetical protein